MLLVLVNSILSFSSSITLGNKNSTSLPKIQNTLTGWIISIGWWPDKKSYKRIKNRKTFDKIQKNLHQGNCLDADFSAVLRGLEYDTEASESSKWSQKMHSTILLVCKYIKHNYKVGYLLNWCYFCHGFNWERDDDSDKRWCKKLSGAIPRKNESFAF